MLLAIDIGNTNIVIGCIKDETILFNERVSTKQSDTDLEYAIEFKTIFEIHNISPDEIDGVVMSSVVPSLISTIKRAVKKLVHAKILNVDPGVKTGLRIELDNVVRLGSDLVVDAVAGLAYYGAPLIIIDMGTATTMSVVDKNGTYIGGHIIPGLRTALDAMINGTAQLPKVNLEKPKRVIGKNTVECINNGILLFTAAGIDGMIDKIEDELGYKCTVIATGGLSGIVTPLCKKDIIFDDDLLLKGLMIIYNKNR